MSCTSIADPPSSPSPDMSWFSSCRPAQWVRSEKRSYGVLRQVLSVHQQQAAFVIWAAVSCAAAGRAGLAFPGEQAQSIEPVQRPVRTVGLNRRREAGGMRADRPRAKASAARPSRTFRCQSACSEVSREAWPEGLELAEGCKGVHRRYAGGACGSAEPSELHRGSGRAVGG